MKLPYRPEIDGLRAVAVLPVILFHAGFSAFSGGYVGVDIFFVISGYLITRIIVNEISENRFTFSSFYERRIRRIFPALFTVMLVSTVVAYFALLPSDLIDFGESLIAIPLFLSNLLFWSERGYFGIAADLKPLLHTWSLAVEEQFYIVYPVILLLCFQYWRKGLNAVLFSVFAISLAVSWYVTKLHFETAYYLPFSRAWELLFGAFAALYAPYFQRFKTPSSLLSAVGLAMIGYSIVAFDRDTLFPGVMALIPVGGAFLILISPSQGNIIHRLLSQKIVIGIGLLSYSLYLWHQPIFSFARHWDINFDDYSYGLIALTFLLSIANYRWIEAPWRNRNFISRKWTFISAVLGSLAFMCAGFFIIKYDGFMNRYSLDDQALLKQYAALDGYNQARFDSMLLQNFDDDGRRKILLVGDSYGKDLINVIYEGGLDKGYQFSTKQINGECGNLAGFNAEELEVYIRAARQERCKVIGRYDGEKMHHLLLQADEIWLASAWTDWVIDLLPQSLETLQARYQKPIKIFGRKRFPYLNQKSALSLEKEDRLSYLRSIPQKSIDQNIRMNATLDGYHFIDLLDKFCSGDAKLCSSFTPDGHLISPDGGHLTREGAIYLAPVLRATLFY